ncbi:L,D-transpeptidase [Streptomyces sp. NBC_01190]|uniref:L,D-transpeptidase n=1 Tax=Streptomyces sp. NBC_01190 TaxID=2903767 RepID=UPI00386901C1|nr:L,D-transpeptidase [Streptomyces sp. NBC_01190]
MSGIPAWATVTGLTGSALAVVSVLALQASGSPAGTPAAAPKPRPTATSRPTTPPPPPPVPANSGTGKRIVYSLAQQRVWVVPPAGKPVSTFTVTPGPVPAKPGSHYVTGHVAQPTQPGGDGAKIEHVVYFEYTAETWVAFSARVDDKVLKPPPSVHTGAIRAHRADIAKIFDNTVIGSTVVVLP